MKLGRIWKDPRKNPLNVGMDFVKGWNLGVQVGLLRLGGGFHTLIVSRFFSLHFTHTHHDG